MKKIIILISFLFLTTGCSYQEINDLAIASALGIDYKDNYYTLTAQIMDIKKNSDGSISPGAIIYKANGKTISEAMRNLTTKYPKSIYLSHIELVIIGKDAIENKMEDSLDFILRSPYTNEFADLIVNTEGKASEILNPKIEAKDSFPIDDIISSIEQTEKKQGTIKKTNVLEFVSEYLETGIDPVLPIILVNKNQKSEDESKSTLSQMATFKKNVINKPLDKNQAIAYNTINNNYYDIIVVVKYKDTKLSIILFNPKSKIKVNLKNNQVNVNINVSVEARIGENHKNNEMLNKNTINEIEKLASDDINNKIKSLLEYCNQYNVDLLGIKNKIYKNYYKEYNNYKDKNLYQDAKFNIKTNVNMYRFGSIYTGNLGGHNE